MSKGAQDHAKSYLISPGYGTNIFSIPGVNGVGIMEGAIHVTTSFYDPAQDQIPSSLSGDTSFEGLPIVIERTGPLEHLQATRQSGGQSGVVQGGSKISRSGEWGTCFGVLQGSDGRYACTSSHVIGKIGTQVSVGGRVVGSTKIDARHCNGKSFLDLAACLLNKDVQSSFDIIGPHGKVTPKGFKKPEVNMSIDCYGLNTKGSTQKIHSINFTSHDDTGGNCPSSYSDLWLGSVRSKPGDSGSSMYTSDGYLVGVLTSNTGQYSWNCSAIHIPQEMGLNIGGTGASSISPQKQQAQRSRTAKAYQGWLTIA